MATADLPDSGRHARGEGVTFLILAYVHSKADTAGIRAVAVSNVAKRERVGGHAVASIFDRLLATANHGPLQVSIARHLNLEAAVAGPNPALLLHAGVVVVNLALADVRAESGTCTHRARNARALTLAVEGRRILQALDVQVALDVRHHLAAADHSSLQVGVAAAGDRQPVAGTDAGVDLGRAFAVDDALTRAGTRRQAIFNAILAYFGCHANRRAPTLALAVLALGVLRGQQANLVVGRQRHVRLRAHFAADDIDIAGLAAAGRANGDIVAGRENAAAMGAARCQFGAFAFGMAHGQTYLGARTVLGEVLGGVFHSHCGRCRCQSLEPAR